MEIINAFALIINYIIIPGLTYGCQLALGALGPNNICSFKIFKFCSRKLMSFGAMTSILITWIISYFDKHPLPTVILALPYQFNNNFILSLTRKCFQYHRKKLKNVISLIVSIGVMFLLVV